MVIRSNGSDPQHAKRRPEPTHVRVDSISVDRAVSVFLQVSTISSTLTIRVAQRQRRERSTRSEYLLVRLVSRQWGFCFASEDQFLVGFYLRASEANHLLRKLNVRHQQHVLASRSSNRF